MESCRRLLQIGFVVDVLDGPSKLVKAEWPPIPKSRLQDIKAGAFPRHLHDVDGPNLPVGDVVDAFEVKRVFDRR